METVRITKRVPKSCEDCYRRRVKCNKQIPCDVCLRRGTQDTCRREKVMVNGRVFNETSTEYTKALELKNRLLQKENNYLKAKMEELQNTSSNSTTNVADSETQKVSEYVHFGKTASLLNLVSQASSKIDYTYDDYDRLSVVLTYEVSLELIRFNFDSLYFFHAVVIPEIFLKEHEQFFTTDGQHINNQISKTRDEYLWLSVYYALISNSFFLLDSHHMKQLHIDETHANRLGTIAWYASIESLNRGQYLQFPDVRSLQTFGILATCLRFFGLHTQNTLLKIMIYIARSLNLDKLVKPNKDLNLLNFELSCRIWWLLVVVDWFEDTWNNRSSEINDFTTPRPRNISDFNLINSIESESTEFLPITFNLFIYDLSDFKKHYYYTTTTETTADTTRLQHLEYAAAKIESLRTKMDVYSIPANADNCVKFAQFILSCKFSHELLVVGRHTINWKQAHDLSFGPEIKMCTDSSVNMIGLVNNHNYPDFYKRYWLVPEHSINGAVFLLLNIILDEKSINVHKIKVIEVFIVNLQKYINVPNNPISNGMRILKRLVEIIQQKFNNESYRLEIREVSNLLTQLEDFQKVYNYGANGSPAFLHDKYWDEFLQWMSHETYA
ncbi:hypothetical protein CANTEDRAFT_136642 [Yamadazyma tenuis ATCC 10573]|uniref:Zn(2)-C6 fungal-type domain-containing protein n=1 Tax=Candida tenuis (strain ATCC 10573 / BCRC 21748 / CBS 615 / JCM 9827 / NBRC 10315 / NRRL Y-1498 / VKM Y-70) TaxID=590646 RepID=G3BC85_CANTC|nr:uncharacterized protein CANTEDRAFT_136642 [Yamadazyma tenuis ATCC 10573]EGV60141.1 hypothetical protein CANTEDRAFT_136642 [Yamadazyma tenuis ATCC 10573]